MRECVDAAVGGIKAMMIAMTILILAWSLGAVTQDVGTAGYLSGLLTRIEFPLFLLPTLVFVTSGAMAFATGTSWTTMAILIPLVIPLTVSLAGGGFADGSVYGILLATTSSVLAGAIWGDHCSPISDTTVLSSTAAACDHLDHVRTQLPYAMLVGVVGILLGSLGTALGLPNWVALLAGVAVLALYLRFFGTHVAEAGGQRGGTPGTPAESV